MKLLEQNDLMIQAVGTEGIVEIAQEFRPLARHKVHATNFPFLQDLVGIERSAQ